MRIDIATLFVDMCERVLDESIIGRARKNGKLEVCCHNIRDYTKDKHRRVDDTPYGGGKGMLMQAQPIYDCYLSVCEKINAKPYVVYMSPKGKTLTQGKAAELSKLSNIFIICGHYEGVDQRIIDEIVDEEISIGDYVLTGGELAALVLTDCVGRLCKGVLADDICFIEESHYNGLLEYPQYTRPPVWQGKAVPEVLQNGHHANIEKWRKEQALKLTLERRPDMLEKYNFSKQDIKILNKIKEEINNK